MKVLLVGPLPPPNGGISVHVMQTQRRLTAAGAQCCVLDPSRTRGKFVLVGKLMRYASQGWAIQLHTNGHNTKSWLMALICGTIARTNRVPATLTLHSGMVPQYVGSTVHRTLARLACSLYQHIVCVSPAIEEAIVSLGVDRQTIEVRPAFTPPEDVAVSLDQPLIDWMESHSPLLSTTLFFRPEYGFPLLVEAIARLRSQYPKLGCVVWAVANTAATPLSAFARRPSTTTCCCSAMWSTTAACRSCRPATSSSAPHCTTAIRFRYAKRLPWTLRCSPAAPAIGPKAFISSNLVTWKIWSRKLRVSSRLLLVSGGFVPELLQRVKRIWRVSFAEMSYRLREMGRTEWSARACTGRRSPRPIKASRLA